jgi:hypothetical protein
MSVTELIKAIEILVTEMRDLTIRSRVPENTYNKIIQVDQNLSPEELTNSLVFLRTVKLNEYREVLDIWKLLPPNVWDMYWNLGERNLREQKLLRDAQRSLRTVWEKRYGKEKSSVEGSNSEQSVGRIVRPES